MANFYLRHVNLPYRGIIRGARGHKQVIIPPGRRICCIMHKALYYWSGYLDADQALQCMQGLEETILPSARRHIDLPILITWNFQSSIPDRISRPKGEIKI